MDDINISLVNGKSPEEWATEKTLGQILAILRAQQKTSKKTDADQRKTLLDILNGDKNSQSSLEKLLGETAGSRKDANEREKRQKAMVRSGAKKAGMKDDGPSKAFMDAFGSDGFLGKTLGALAVALDTFVSAVMAGVNGYNDVYRAGMVATAESFTDFNDGFRELGVGAGKLSEDLVGYTSTINQFGIAPIVKSSKALADKFGKLGFTVNDTTRSAAEFMERQRLSFHTEQVSSEQLTKMQIRAFDTTKRFSQVLGISVEQMEKLQNAQAAEVNQRLATMDMLPEVAREYESAMTTMKQLGMGGVVDALNNIQIVGKNAAQATPALQKLLTDMGPDVYRKVLDVGDLIKNGGVKTNEEFKAAMMKIAASISDPAQRARFKAQFTAGEEAGLQMVAFAKDTEQRLKSVGEDIPNGALDLSAQIETFKLKFASSMERMLSGVLTTENMDTISAGLKVLIGVMDGFVDKGNAMMKGDTAQAGLKTTVSTMVATLSTVIDSLSRLPQALEELMDSIYDFTGGESAMASEVEEYKKMTGKDFYNDKSLIDPKTGRNYDWDSSSQSDIDDDDLSTLRKVNRELRKKEQARIKGELQRPLNEVRAKNMGMETKSPVMEMLQRAPESPNTPLVANPPTKQNTFDDVVSAMTGLQLSLDRNSDVTASHSKEIKKQTDAYENYSQS